MSDYTKTVNFAAKDSLSTGNSNKVVRGSEIDTEFNNIATAVATKLNSSGAVFTNAVSFPDGTATSPAITNTGDTNTGLFFSAADTIAYTAGGTAQVTFADGLIAPVTTNDVDLGTGSLQFKDAFFDGTVKTDLLVADTSLAIAGDGATVTGIKDEDDMSSNSNVKLATQQSIKAYVDASSGVSDGAVTTAKLASNAVTTAKITDANVTTAKIADDAVTAAKLASNAVVTASIVDDNVTQAKIADDAVGADQLAASAVVTASMVDDAVTVAKMADNSIDSAQYVDGSIDTAHIADSQITVAKMAANSIDSDQYVDGSIDTAHIADSQITSAKIADGTIATGDIADDAVTSAKIADNAVDIARLNVSDGSAGQALTTNGSGTLSFAAVGGLYNDWAVKTSAYTMVSGDQIIVNASGATTITLPASSAAGATVTIKATGGGTVTIGRNSQNINSTGEDGTLQSGNAVQLVFVDSTIGFLEI